MATITDALIIAATVAGPVIAVQTQKLIERATERRQQQRRIFSTLMATRAARVSPMHVEALNAIDIHFRGNGWRLPTSKEREVSRRWRIYSDHLSLLQDGASEALATAWNVNKDEYFTDLLEAMAKALGYSFDRVELKRGIYSPRAHGDAELQQMLITRGLADLLTGKSPLAMKVVEFPVSEEAIDMQMQLQAALLRAVADGKITVKLEQSNEDEEKPEKKAA